MPYLFSVTKAGKTIEVEKYYSSRYKKKGIKRKDKVKPTSEQQRKINEKQAEKKLRRDINENFGPGDLHIDLTYLRKRGQPHVTKDQMRDDINIFLRALREIYKKSGMELKYIHVMEIGDKGARHHHLIVNYIDIRFIQKLWKPGYVYFTPLDNTGDYRKLASYFIKYSSKTIGTEKALQGKRWNSSKNLRHPEPEIKIISEKEWYRTEAKPFSGYYIDTDSIEIGIHSPEYYGYGYYRYTMIKIDNTNPQARMRKRD